jgi:ketosteroid isomerase-like protein
MEGFLRASLSGDMEALLELLSDDVTLYSDGGGKTARAFREGALVCPDQAYGKFRWEAFLRSLITTGKEVTGR